jgi:hypothetical protein
VALKANDFDTADHVSKNMGQVEQVEANEGMSYGVNDMRDGINLSRIQVTRPLVLATQVQNLPNFYGFLRFGRNVPVVTFTDAYNTLPDVAPGFAERLAPPQPHEKAAQLILLAQAESKLREAAERTTKPGVPLAQVVQRAQPPAGQSSASEAPVTKARRVKSQKTANQDDLFDLAATGASDSRLPRSPRPSWSR